MSFNQTPRPDGCTCHLESSFIATDADENGMIEVVDAECEVIGIFKRRDYAELVAWALGTLDAEQGAVCAVHFRGFREVYEKRYAPPAAPPSDGPNDVSYEEYRRAANIEVCDDPIQRLAAALPPTVPLDLSLVPTETLMAIAESGKKVPR